MSPTDQYNKHSTECQDGFNFNGGNEGWSVGWGPSGYGANGGNPRRRNLKGRWTMWPSKDSGKFNWIPRSSRPAYVPNWSLTTAQTWYPMWISRFQATLDDNKTVSLPDTPPATVLLEDHACWIHYQRPSHRCRYNLPFYGIATRQQHALRNSRTSQVTNTGRTWRLWYRRNGC